MFSNGFIIQELRKPTNYGKSFVYKGIKSFLLWPLLGHYDKTANAINDKVISIRFPDGMYQIKEFITEYDVLAEYLNECKKREIEVRVLFVESDSEDEQCAPPPLDMTYIGYECCPIPIDNIVITDFDFHANTLFKKHTEKLNAYGLFDSYEDALDFKREYDALIPEDIVGDGGVDSFVSKLYEVDDKCLLDWLNKSN